MGLGSGSILYLKVLVPAADGSEQILDLVLMLLGLTGPVGQHFLEKAVLNLEAELQLLQNLAGNRADRSQQGAAQLLQPTGK